MEKYSKTSPRQCRQIQTLLHYSHLKRGIVYADVSKSVENRIKMYEKKSLKAGRKGITTSRTDHKIGDICRENRKRRAPGRSSAYHKSTAHRRNEGDATAMHQTTMEDDSRRLESSNYNQLFPNGLIHG